MSPITKRRWSDAFALYAEKIGVREVKTGYVADAGDIVRYDEEGVLQYEWHDSQFMVGHHLRVIEAAAEHQISINAHEPVKDTGLRRTYPNWMTRDGRARYGVQRVGIATQPA